MEFSLTFPMIYHLTNKRSCINDKIKNRLAVGVYP